MIYLDNAATTLPDPEVVATMVQTLEEFPGNPSSLHALGRAANKLLSASRETVAGALGGGGALHFTSGGTESINWAILGALHAMRHRGRHIIATGIEHDAVLAPLAALSQQGYEVTLLPADAEGQVSPCDLEAALRDDTVLVSAMLVNNETGAILPIAEMVEVVRSYRRRRAVSSAPYDILFHTDAVQAFCKIPFTAEDLGVDLLSVSAHKLHGPKGVGALWVRDGLHFPPLLRGGGQEMGLRSGTEALHNIAGFAKAVELAQSGFAGTTAHFAELQAYLRGALSVGLDEAERRDAEGGVPYVVFLPQGVPHIVSLSLPGTKSEVVMNYLDRLGIAVSHASACKRGGRSHVLTAMGLSQDVIDGTIRVSFSRDTTLAEIDALVAGLKEAYTTLFPQRRGSS